MEIIAKSNFIMMSPRKLRLVGETIKNLPVLEALEKIKFIKKRGTEPFINVLKQAIGNAKNNFNLNGENLIIKEIIICEGPRLKRMDKSHGARFDRGVRQKRMSHIKIILTEKILEKDSKSNSRLPKNKSKKSEIQIPKS